MSVMCNVDSVMSVRNQHAVCEVAAQLDQPLFHIRLSESESD